MYKLMIRLDTDKDFGHKCKTVNNDNPQIDIYYNDRNSAIIKLKAFYKQLASSVYTDKIEMFPQIDMIKDFEEYLHLIVKAYDTFKLNFCLGNPDFEIELIKVESKILECTGITLIEHVETLQLYINENFKVEYAWDKLRNLLKERGNNNEII